MCFCEFVCLCVCVCVCVFVFVFVFLRVCVRACVGGWVGGWVAGWVGGLVSGCVREREFPPNRPIPFFASLILVNFSWLSGGVSSSSTKLGETLRIHEPARILSRNASMRQWRIQLERICVSSSLMSHFLRTWVNEGQ